MGGSRTQNLEYSSEPLHYVWSFPIKYQIKHLGKIIIGCTSLALLGLTILLIVEYRFFHDQAQKMLELKEEYRTYTLAVKKILNEYNAMKEQAGDSLDTSATKESFLVVNREANYLQKSAIAYLQQQSELLEYNQHNKKNKQTIQQPKKRARKKRTTMLAYPEWYKDIAGSAPKDLALVWPIDRSHFWLSSFFGPRRKQDHSWGFHYGIDMAACKGTPVVAASDGIVIEAHFDAGYGNTILISHNAKYKTRYAHLDKILVCVGQKVERGLLIGKVGATGAVRKKKGRDASHLHFEVYAHGKKINPLSFFI